MGAILSRRKKKQSTEEILEDLQDKIEALEESKQTNIEKQKHLIGSLILYSIVLYVGAALLFYFYYMPESVSERITYASPLAVFPILVWLIKSFLHWYFVKRISKNEAALNDLQEQKNKILDEVMETETYKKAKEILEKYDPEKLTGSKFSSPNVSRSPEGQELRQRKSNPSNLTVKDRSQEVPHFMLTTPVGPTGFGQQKVRPPATRPNIGESASPQNIQDVSAVTAGHTIKPALPRPLLPENRSVFDRFVDYLLGDGPQNRYALICRNCHHHNGMALKEEYEYFSFHCCYCNFLNPARKQRPKVNKQKQQQQQQSVDTSKSHINESRLRDGGSNGEVKDKQTTSNSDETQDDTD